MTTRTETKQKAHYELICAMQIALADPKLPAEMVAEMHTQMARVEKLFGYAPHSWPRGC